MSEEIKHAQGEQVAAEAPLAADALLAAEALPAADEPSKIPAFKNVCMRLGLMMVIVFVSRGVCTVLMSLLAPGMEELGATRAYIIQSAMSLVFLYLIPMSFAVWIMKEPTRETCGRIYSKPQYFGRALGMFPAFYGLAICVNFIVLFISRFISDPDLNRSFNTVNDLQADNLACALILFVQLVVIAPLFEEFWFRGIVMESLRPYGNGFAIFVSALLFGLTHANFQQFFYAFVIGVCLGYIAVSTKSIITTTVMHAMFNGISGLLLLFMSVPAVGDYLLELQRGGYTEGVTPDMPPVVVVYLVYLAAVVLLMLVGLIMAAFKLAKIKKYRVPKMWTELTAAQRWGVFLSRATVIIMLVLAADTLTFRLIPKFFYGLFAK